MSIKFLFLYIIILSFVSSATAQTTLTSEANAPRNGDDIEREVMAVPSHVAAGSNCVWDFSMLERTGERHETMAGAGILNDLDVTVSGGMVSVSYSLTVSPYSLQTIVLKNYHYEPRKEEKGIIYPNYLFF